MCAQEGGKGKMGKQEKDGSCKRHPSHRNSNGVCPYCLRDRLTNFSLGSSFSSTNNGVSSTASSTLCSSYDSQISSLEASPPHDHRRERSSAKDLVRLLMGDGGHRIDMLRKSKSLAGYSKDGEENRAEEEKKKKKNRSGRVAWKLWERLIKRKHKGGGLPRSETMKEKSSSKWNFFSN